ncbi:MAG: cytochrome c3 family protein [Thermodesulfobacteriota bacterium]
MPSLCKAARPSGQLAWRRTLAGVLLAGSCVAASPASSRVSGVCANCHTMHNSQAGQPVAAAGTGAGWDASGRLAGPAGGPVESLLISDCVGCHSSTTSETIIQVGGVRIPVVYNTVPPVNPLAGGNFHWVVANGDGYGHNVRGIAGEDQVLAVAPGKLGGCNNSCHDSLAREPGSSQYNNGGGCKGCHYQVFHHQDNDRYRFLVGHQTGDCYVTGVEDADWEQVADGSHNLQHGHDRDASPGALGLARTQSISSYCGGCHGLFHDSTRIRGAGDTWLRHPTDILLPEVGEYAAYNPVTDSSTEAPVAWLDPTQPRRTEAVVSCLSCHRPHGSDQPDLLRWDYASMAEGTGCFTCHTDKD